MFKQISNLIKIVLAITVISFGVTQTSTAYAGGGDGGDREFQSQQKLAKELKTIGTPYRTRAKVISSVGLFFGTVVGEIATTGVTCIARCFGVDDGYRFGDMSKQSWKGFKKMWNMDEGEKQTRSNRTRKVVQETPRKTGYTRNGIGTRMGYQAINPDR